MTKQTYLNDSLLLLLGHQTLLSNPALSLPPQALSSDGRLFSRAVPLLNIQPMLRIDYVATAMTLDLLTPHQTTLDALGVTAAQWDPHQGPVPGGAVGGADLVVCNHAWGPLGAGAEVVVENLASGAKEGGFVMLHTLLKGETLSETVAFLTSKDSKANRQRLFSQVSRTEVDNGSPELFLALSNSSSIIAGIYQLQAVFSEDP